MLQLRHTIICPGIHSPQLTDCFLEGFQSNFCHRILVVPTLDYPPYCIPRLWLFLRENLGSPANSPPLLFLAFSAGVVGAMGVAWLWQQQGGKVQAVIALDGWGVLKMGNFPVYRLSHDYFTHWSSALLGGEKESFYAQPAVTHLELWQSPPTVWGWWVLPSGNKCRCSAADFLEQIVVR